MLGKSIRPMLAVWMTIVIVAHLGLAGQGWWADEYLDIALMRRMGLGFLTSRVLGWAPRPFSEAVFMLYGASVIAIGRPLVTSALLSFYAAGALLLAIAFRCCRPSGIGLALVGTVAVWMCGGHMNELLFWPAGALAYLPTLVCVLVLAVIGHAPGRHDGLMLLALLVAAGSSEVGATLVLLFVAGRLVPSWIARSPGWSPAPTLWVLLAPALLAITVLLRVSTSRLATPELIGYGSSAIRGHALRSGFAAARVMVGEFGRSGHAKVAPALLLGKLAWLAGCTLLAPTAADQRQKRVKLALAGACLGASAMSLVLAFYHFGGPCCDRHAGVRGLLGLVGLLLLASVTLRRRNGTLGGVLIVLGALLVSVPRVAPLVAQYRLYPTAVARRSGLWASGRSPGPVMRMAAPVDGPLVYPQPYHLGRTRFDPNIASVEQFTLQFFHKQVLDVVGGGG